MIYTWWESNTKPLGLNAGSQLLSLSHFPLIVFLKIAKLLGGISIFVLEAWWMWHKW